MLTVFKVGSPAPEQVFPPRLRGMSCAVMDQLSDDSGGYGIYITICLDRMTDKEEMSLRTEPIKTAYVADGPYFLALFNISGVGEFDATYDPCIRPPDDFAERLAAWQGQNLVTILGVDSSTGILCSIRAATMPKKFHAALMRTLIQPHGPSFSQEYDEWLEVQYRTPVKRLWETAEYAGRFGDPI